MKTTWTQLVVALNKNVYPAAKPIVWGLNKPAVFYLTSLWAPPCVCVCVSVCVSGVVYCVMACSEEMTFCTNSENFPQGDGDNKHTHTHTHTHTHSKRPTHRHRHTNASMEPDFGQVWLRGNEILFLLTQTIVFLLTLWQRLSQQSPWDGARR